jgi:hypothetical protein
VSFSDLDAAAKRAVPSAQKRADSDDDFVFVELYATGKSQPGPARLELTRRQVVVPVCALEAIVLVVHADHDVSLPLEGVVDAFRLPLEGSLTHLALGLRVQLRASSGRRAAATRRMASVTARRRSA